MKITTTRKLPETHRRTIQEFIPNLKTLKCLFSNPDSYHFVYCIVNLYNGKFYVGKHTSVREPKGRSKYFGSNTHLHRAIAKYGSDQFRMLVLKYFKTDLLAYQYEGEVITQEMVDSELCYNQQGGGWGSILGIKQTPEVLKKKSKATKRAWKNKSEEERQAVRDKIGAGNRGKPNPYKGQTRVLSEKHLKAMRKASRLKRGKPRSVEITWGAKISEAKTKYYVTEVQLLKYLKKNPDANVHDITSEFGNRSVLTPFGGIRALRAKLGLTLANRHKERT